MKLELASNQRDRESILLSGGLGRATGGFPGGSDGKEPTMWETWVRSLDWEDSLGEGRGNPFQYSCLENPHGQRSLAGYRPWGRKESDTTKYNPAHIG